MSDLKHDNNSKLLWVDLEMTGLEPTKDYIIEIAAIVTDFDFTELDTYKSVIYQPQQVLSQMNEWSREMTIANGLIDRIKAAPNEQHVEIEFIDFIKRNFNEPAILAGNSVYNDYAFIKQWWPGASTLLHYRLLDVSSFKIIMQDKYKIIFNKKELHRSLDDIRESIAELKFYLNYIKKG